MYMPSHSVDLEPVWPTSQWTPCPTRVVKVDGILLKRQQREIYSTFVIFLKYKLLKIDENRNRCFGYSGRGFGMDLLVRTEYCPVEGTVRIAWRFMVTEYWGDHEAVDVIAKLWRKPHQWECRFIMPLLPLHVS